ncbi:MAG: flagellar hook-basal body complex protein FliE [Phycisphaerae bacterium]|nr:flagellar hook-basal body complex protein FliE [Phycisphaerae bacterium]
MADPTIGSSGLTPLRPIQAPASTTPVTRPEAPGGKDFSSYLLESLEKVNRLQLEADEGVQKVLTGETDNVAEVFSATRKAGIAFDMLMEIRNKLMDAYAEVQQMRV